MLRAEEGAAVLREGSAGLWQRLVPADGHGASSGIFEDISALLHDLQRLAATPGGLVVLRAKILRTSATRHAHGAATRPLTSSLQAVRAQCTTANYSCTSGRTWRSRSLAAMPRARRLVRGRDDGCRGGLACVGAMS
eukprot:TRINITY_DN68450_c0_g1_i1.p4 TRINITY_DN68450_c0_g1~~TRINITY_DN68450_c0_g1_i1.p4  ORF type:complete len:137 (+),score=9.12 TRINITY_DN68450_c0_g1_i1:872-1282(+)